MAPGGLRAPRNSLAIEDTEHAPEAVRRGLAVREPPRHRDAAAVGVDELHPRAVIEAVLRVGAPDAGLLDAAPRGLPSTVGVRGVVRPDRAGLEPSRDPPGTLRVARPDARPEAERRIVREPHGFVLRVEWLHRHDRPEDLLALDSRLPRAAREHRRL